MNTLIRAVLLLLICWTPRALAAQQATAPDALRVFLDCQNTFCDFDYLRREIPWVNWMRERQDAEVHLLVTSQGTGSGGREYTLRLIGLGLLAGRQQEVRAASPQAATDDEIRQIMARGMRLGLAGFAGGPLARRLDVRFTPPEGGMAPAGPRRDPWNFWVFRLGINGNIRGESRSSSSQIGGFASAQRITDAWRYRVEVDGQRRSEEFTLDDGDVFESVTTDWETDAFAVRSFGPHWSLGLFSEAGRSFEDNLEFGIRAAPGIEYNIWPYAQSSRRQLVFRYELGVNRFSYMDTTVYDKVRETLAEQRLLLGLRTREPWGTTNLSIEGAAYLHDLARNEFRVGGGLGVRVIRGFSVDLFANYSRVRNQLYLPKEGASDEEILLRLRSLETSFRYSIFLGLSYSFGATSNNIVNPRFGGF